MDRHDVMLITGASRSIGEHLTNYYLRQGYRVIGCSRSESSVKHDRYRHFVLDVRNEAKVMEMFREISKTYGSLSVVINNAGMQTINHSMLTDYKTVEDVFATNMFGAFLICRESAKLMKKSNYGRIVNISSIAVPLSSVGNAIYSASKAALEQFSKVLAKEVAGFGIRANVLGLSVVAESGMGEKISEAALKQTLDAIAIKDKITGEDITHAIDFLISEKSKSITGQTIYLGGA